MKNTELSVCPLCLPLVGLFLCLFSTQLLPWDPSSLGTYPPPLQTVRCATHPTPLAPRQLRVVLLLLFTCY